MKNLISLISTIAMLLVVTSVSVLYSDGWRIRNPFGRDTEENPNGNILVMRTGMLAVRSIPDGAKVYINNELRTATNDTISSLTPGEYTLRVEKEGFEPWQKQINVYSELVTDITAILISQTPKLEPLTSTEIRAFALSPDYNDIVFVSNKNEEPGIWSLPLTSNTLNILRNSAKPVIRDTAQFSPSLANGIWWSWDRKEVLVELNPRGYLLYKFNTGLLNNGFGTSSVTPQQLSNKEEVLARWDEAFRTEYQRPLINQLFDDIEIPEQIRPYIESQTLNWSPDENKFIVEVPNSEDPTKIDLLVYNGESTLPVDEKRLNITVRGIDPTLVKYSWYTDSYHLILQSKVDNRPSDYTISMIRIDGTNLTPVYTGYLASDQAYATPYGDKIIVLTSLKEGTAPNLYGIAIR